MNDMNEQSGNSGQLQSAGDQLALAKLVGAAGLMLAEIDTCGHEVDQAYRNTLHEAWEEGKSALASRQPLPEGFVLVPADCIGAVRVARLAMLEKEARADELMDAAMWADAAADLKKIIKAARPEVQG